MGVVPPPPVPAECKHHKARAMSHGLKLGPGPLKGSGFYAPNLTNHHTNLSPGDNDGLVGPLRNLWARIAVLLRRCH